MSLYTSALAIVALCTVIIAIQLVLKYFNTLRYFCDVLVISSAVILFCLMEIFKVCTCGFVSQGCSGEYNFINNKYLLIL